MTKVSGARASSPGLTRFSAPTCACCPLSAAHGDDPGFREHRPSRPPGLGLPTWMISRGPSRSDARGSDSTPRPAPAVRSAAQSLRGSSSRIRAGRAHLPGRRRLPAERAPPGHLSRAAGCRRSRAGARPGRPPGPHRGAALPGGCGRARRGGAAEGAARDAPKGTAEGRGRCRKLGRGAARDALKGERRGGGDECLCGHRRLRAVPLGHPGHLCLQPPGGPARVSGRARRGRRRGRGGAAEWPRRRASPRQLFRWGSSRPPQGWGRRPAGAPRSGPGCGGGAGGWARAGVPAVRCASGAQCGATEVNEATPLPLSPGAGEWGRRRRQLRAWPCSLGLCRVRFAFHRDVSMYGHARTSRFLLILETVVNDQQK